MGSLVYDTGALIAADNDQRNIWAIHKRALQRGTIPDVPAGVLAEAWRGNSPRLSRLLAGTRTVPLTDSSARGAGLLLAATSRPVQVIDATVVETATSSSSAVVTSDYEGIAAIASSTGRRLDIIPI